MIWQNLQHSNHTLLSLKQHCKFTAGVHVDDISDDYEALLQAFSAPCSLQLHHYSGLVVRIKLHQILLNHCAMTFEELYLLI